MFVHLRCHSHYSFLRAVPRPEELVAAAAEQARACDATVAGAGLQPARASAGRFNAVPDSLRGGAVALTDTDGLYAAVPFYTHAKAAGVKPIVGTVLDVSLECGSLLPLSHGAACCAADGTKQAAAVVADLRIRPGRSEDRPLQLLLLAENFAGYSNLCRLVTTRHLEERPVTVTELAERKEGLIALFLPRVGKDENRKAESGNRNSAIDNRQSAIDNCFSLATHHSSLLKDIFGDALYFEAQRLWPGDGRQLRETLRLNRELGVPVVTTNNVHFLMPEEHLHHRVLNAVRTGALLSTVDRPDITSAEAYFKSAAEMHRAFPDHPELLHRTLEIAERCNLELTLGKTIFPEFPTPAGESPFSFLWKLCFEGAQRRYRPLTPPVLARLTRELEVIEKLNLAPYFLLVWDIVEEAKRRQIPAVARGSAASSMVTYCLGISRVCPLRWGLYFERFLNEQRGDIPDIDLDICGARRDELLDYVYQRWGQAHVAMIASFVTMHARLAIREVAKVFGIPPAEVNHFTRRLPHRPVREILEAIRTLPECRSLPVADEPWKTVLEVALRLDDFPRHLGIHPCGTVIAAQPLTQLAPLEVATKGIVVTQYDMHAVEALGLIKMDLLGQRGLTTMSLALKNIETRKTKIETRPNDSALPCPITGDKNVPSDVAGQARHDVTPGIADFKSEISVLKSELSERNSKIETRPAKTSAEHGSLLGSIAGDASKNSHTCHPERSEGSALHRVSTENADSSPRPEPSGLGMTEDILQPSVYSRPSVDFQESSVMSEISDLKSEISDCKSSLEAGIDFDSIPEGDPATCDLLARGRTLGIFQIESPGMRGLLRALRARTLDDVCLALALIRPGAAEYGSKESFLRRLRCREPVRYPHPCTEPILRETLGICVYQEQVMQLAQAAGSLTLAEADLVRRASAKFADRRERERLHSKFLKAAERLGLDGRARDDTWHMVEKFAGFGFCKAHAATYADLSYRIAYLKAHYPAEFLAAMCSSGAGFYHVSAYVEEAKRWGIEVRLPSVNHSRCEYTTEAQCEISNFKSDIPPLAAVRIDDVAQASSLCASDSVGAQPVVARVFRRGDFAPHGTGPASEEAGYSAAGDGHRTHLEVCPTPSENLPRAAIRIGLMQVKGLRAETMATIVREREGRGPYRSLEDFLARVPVERDEIESLIKCGSFDEVGQPVRPVPVRVSPIGEEHKTDLEVCPTRPALLWRLNLALAHRSTHAGVATGEMALFSDASGTQGREAPGAAIESDDFVTVNYTREQRLRYEQEILEVCVSGHPLDRFPRNGEVWSTDVLQATEALREKRAPGPGTVVRVSRRENSAPHGTGIASKEAGDTAVSETRIRRRALLIGQRVTLLGWVITYRRVGTKNYRNMMFVTCEDQRGVYEVVLFPPAYERYGGLVFETRLVRVTGRVEPDGQINCEKLEPLR